MLIKTLEITLESSGFCNLKKYDFFQVDMLHTRYHNVILN